MRFLRPFLALVVVASLLLVPIALLPWLERLSEGNPPPAPPSPTLLRVALMDHPTVYYQDEFGEPSGLEYDLVSAFAQIEQRELLIRKYNTPEDAESALAAGEVDVVATGNPAPLPLPHTSPQRPAGSPPLSLKTRYHETGWTLLQAPRQKLVKSLDDPNIEEVTVSSRLYGRTRMQNLIKRYPKIHFKSADSNNDDWLIAAIGDGDIEYAIVEEDSYNLSRHFYNDARKSLQIHPPLPRTWLFAAHDGALRDRADVFFGRITREGTIASVLDRYFGARPKLSLPDVDIFTQRVKSLLPKYRSWFHEAQDTYGIEWRLLAALSYQESHWDADAVSPTGPLGIMQFTADTATRFGVDRLDPKSAILGGARYLAYLKRDALPTRIEEPDKTWLALAAYNIGMGHVENARILTQRSKKNPDIWPDVRRHLGMLANPEVANQFRLGPCRCRMPIEYVESVRAYYDILLRLEEPHQPKLRLRW